MSLPASWIDHLFGRLSMRYGVAFLEQYRGLDTAAVKLDWADTLDGVRGSSISYALEYLPERAPNAMQFRNLCRSAPAPAKAIELPAPRGELTDSQRKVLEDLRNSTDTRSPARRVADRLRELRAGGMKLTPSQRDMLAAVEAMP